MKNFDLIQKTHIVFGKEEENNVGRLVKKYSDSCIVIHADESFLTPLLERVFKSLESEGIKYYDFTGVKANPVVSHSNKAIQMVKDNDIGFVLAVGGGSVMDTAKYVAYACYSPDENPLELSIDKTVTHKIIPHGTIVTLNGTSSECSNCAMMMDDLHTPINKYCLTNSCLYFDFSIINPELAYTLPLRQLASGVMDSISHALEAYLAPYEEEPLFEGYYETVIKTLLTYGPKAIKDPKNYDIRSKIAIAVMMAYCDTLPNGGIDQDWGSHGLENPITANYNGTHGVNLGIITPAFLRYVYVNNPRPFKNFAIRCMGVNPENKNDYEIVDEGATKLEKWLKDEMGLPTRFSEVGITYEMIEKVVDLMPPVGGVYRFTKEQCLECLKQCL